MKIIGIIPARYASSRFPGKPLVIIDGKPLIQHVYEQCSKCSDLAEVYVATDDQRIFDAVQNFGGKVFLTKGNHLTGTDRCAELAGQLEADAVINIQGDEINIQPEQIHQVADMLKSGLPIATLARKTDHESAQNPNVVKVVSDKNGRALYFSRSMIPYHSNRGYLQHIGIYGYQKNILLELTQLAPSPLELSESLEQLRWLDNGYEIAIQITEMRNIAIDTPEDLEKLNRNSPV